MFGGRTVENRPRSPRCCAQRKHRSLGSLGGGQRNLLSADALLPGGGAGETADRPVTATHQC